MPARLHRGFTLLELVLVLMLLALVLAAAAPSLGGWNRGQRLENTAERILSAARFARSEAISKAVPHRLEIDATAGIFRVTRLEAQTWVPAGGQFGRDVALSEGMGLELVRQDESGTPAIDFYPNGRISPATIEIWADWGEVVTLQSTAAAESLRMVRDRGGA